ncbi:hypothetical protein [Candidatus Sororendozoicomonas aggregata]|uniref:hypothetical protein n=1 Tax=Candidatus Sororendozoicomonas aggregata TaxID=3073239 RepID=UPI002ED0AAF3
MGSHAISAGESFVDFVLQPHDQPFMSFNGASFCVGEQCFLLVSDRWLHKAMSSGGRQ